MKVAAHLVCVAVVISLRLAAIFKKVVENKSFVKGNAAAVVVVVVVAAAAADGDDDARFKTFQVFLGHFLSSDLISGMLSPCPRSSLVVKSVQAKFLTYFVPIESPPRK